MKNLKRFLPSRGRVVQGSGTIQTSTSNNIVANHESEPSLQLPVTAAVQSSSNEDDQPWGLKLLHGGQEPIADVVAVHGLNGHREETWTDDNKILWLRDLLPFKLPNARIWTWGYDSRTHTKSHRDHLTIKTLYDHGRELVRDLDGERRDDNSYQRPIIFIAHSLGGIVVKSALLHSDRVRKGHLEEERSVKLSTYGIIFMGTPHQGGQGVTVGEILLNLAKVRGNTNDSLLKHLEEHSELLQQQNSEFTSISRDLDIQFAYETLPTPIIGGAAKVIVPKWSAVVPGTSDAAEFGISQDHRRMTKLSSSEDQDFRKLSRVLALMILKAEVKIKSNWSSEGRMNTKQGRQSYDVPFNIRGVPSVGQYVERNREMQNMEEVLLPDEENKQRRIFVLHGLGGIGKTQLSIAYARKHQNDYTAIFWLNGRTRETLKQSISGIASHLPKDQISDSARSCTRQGSEHLDKLVDEVLGWFSREGNGKWLLIFDNVDRDNSEMVEDPEAFDVDLFLPGNDQGTIIITTRQHRLRNLGDEMSVTSMTTEEGLKVLENRIRLPFVDNPQATELVERVGGLPLALAQAASYMRETGTNMTEYLHSYNTVWEDLMKDEARPGSGVQEYGDRSVYTTWTISFDYVMRKNQAAANMLQVWSYLDNRDIWFELFNMNGDLGLEQPSSIPEWFRRVVCNKLNFRRVTAALLDYSLIEARQDSDSYGVHPVVHEWCRKTMNADRRHESALLALTSVAFVGPEDIDRDYWMIQRRILPHANRFSQQLMDMLEENLESEQAIEFYVACNNLGTLHSLDGRAMWIQAEAMYRRAISGMETFLGAHNEESISPLSNLAVLYEKQERFVDAEAILQRALAARSDQLGPDHNLTIDSAYRLASVYNEQNKLVEAEGLYQRVLTWYEKVPGTVHVNLFKTFNALGYLYQKQGKLTKSEAMYLRGLAGCEMALQTDHPYRLRVLYNLGQIYLDLERLVEAETTFQQALDGSKKVFGLDHTRTMDAMHGLGLTLKMQGRLVEAEAMYQRALAGYQEVMGPEHESTSRILNNLGVLYSRQDRLIEAEHMYQQALAGFQTISGRGHKSTLGTIHNLRRCYEEQGKLAEAVALCLQELELYEPYARKDERFFELTDDLGVLYYKQDRLVEAEDMYQQALAGYRTVLGSEHPSTLGTLTKLALCYGKQGKLAEAEALSREWSAHSKTSPENESTSSKALHQEGST